MRRCGTWKTPLRGDASRPQDRPRPKAALRTPRHWTSSRWRLGGAGDSPPAETHIRQSARSLFVRNARLNGDLFLVAPVNVTANVRVLALGVFAYDDDVEISGLASAQRT